MTTTVPVGCLAMFGGDIAGIRISELQTEGWLLCDGTEYPASGEYLPLFRRIGRNYGGSGPNDTFRVPDLRGRFLRGTDHGRGKDPNAAARPALYDGGSTGDATGSAQPFATALPVNQFRSASDGEHQHVAPHLSSDYHNTPLSAWSTYCMAWPGDDQSTSSDGDHSHVVTGGDVETRPVNLYVHLFVKFKEYAP